MRPGHSFKTLLLSALLLMGTLPRMQAQSNSTNYLVYTLISTYCDSLVFENYSGGNWAMVSTIASHLNAIGHVSEMRISDHNGVQQQILFTYDVNDKITGGEIWLPPYSKDYAYQKFTVTFDANNNVTEEASSLLTNQGGGTYSDYERYTYTYDSKGQMISKLKEKSTAGNWENYSLDSFVYTNGGYVTEEHNFNWQSSAWEETGRSTWTFGSGAKPTSEVSESNNGSGWVNVNRFTFGYDGNGNRIRTFQEDWNGSGWDPSQIDSTTTSGTIAYSTVYSYSNGGYVPTSRNYCALSSVALPFAPTHLTVTPRLHKQGDGIMDLAWEDNAANEEGYIIYRSLDGNNWTAIDSVAADIITYTDENLDNTTMYYYKVAAWNSAGMSGFSNVTSATTYASIRNLKADITTSFYPNPAGNVLHITIEGKAIQYTITNMTGQVLINQNIPGQSVHFESEANLSQLPSGMYILNVISPSGSSAALFQVRK
jgi:hypothetical protein